jgi:hypothetical protein
MDFTGFFGFHGFERITRMLLLPPSSGEAVPLSSILGFPLQSLTQDRRQKLILKAIGKEYGLAEPVFALTQEAFSQLVK